MKREPHSFHVIVKEPRDLRTVDQTAPEIHTTRCFGIWPSGRPLGSRRLGGAYGSMLGVCWGLPSNGQHLTRVAKSLAAADRFVSVPPHSCHESIRPFVYYIIYTYYIYLI